MSHFTPLNVTFAILGISFLVIVHEAGHYLAARAFGMRVLRFSIGLGPALWKYKPKDSPTTFQVCALPLLAYVQIDGMNPADEVDPKDPAIYPNKGVFARIMTIFAGPLANYLAAGVMLFVLAQTGGLPDSETTNQIALVAKGSAAQLAKLNTGDRVVEIAGQAVSNYEELTEAARSRIHLTADNKHQPTEFVIERDGERLSMMIRTRILKPMREEGHVRPIIGVVLRSERVFTVLPMNEAASRAVVVPLEMTQRQLTGIAQMIRRGQTAQVQSVVGMTKILSDSLEVAPQEFIGFLILISIALGLFNLLPVPALDGGRLAFLAYEVVTRRRANEKVETAVHTVGLLLLLGILVLVMAKDVARLM